LCHSLELSIRHDSVGIHLGDDGVEFLLTGKLVRVRMVKNRLKPGYLDPDSDAWRDVASQLLAIYRQAPGRTRAEIETELADLLGDGPQQLIYHGLAKLLEDRCEYEVASSLNPEQVREVAFRRSAEAHRLKASLQQPFDRNAVLREAANELGISPEQVEQSLFADLRDEQRILRFDDCTPEQLIHRYNVALAQAVLLRSVRLEIRVWNLSTARFRQLIRQVKFRQLIVTVKPVNERAGGYLLTIDGPLSLFSSTQKYGLQLALFLPALLYCPAYELTAEVLWGSSRRVATFTLSATDGLRSHIPDFGVYTPPLLDTVLANFRANVADWVIDAEPNPQPLAGSLWLPDLTLTHTPTGITVFVELLGYWRSIPLEQHYRRLSAEYPGRFLLLVSEQFRTDDSGDGLLGDGIYRFKRTPIAQEIAKLAAKLIQK